MCVEMFPVCSLSNEQTAAQNQKGKVLTTDLGGPLHVTAYW